MGGPEPSLTGLWHVRINPKGVTYPEEDMSTRGLDSTPARNPTRVSASPGSDEVRFLDPGPVVRQMDLGVHVKRLQISVLGGQVT